MRNTNHLLGVLSLPFVLLSSSFASAAERAAFLSTSFAVPAVPSSPSGRGATPGDFNDDGQPDVLWQHPSRGVLEVWVMDDYKPVRRVALRDTTGDPNLYAVGTDDFDGDGMTDILLWQADTGSTFIWYVQDFKVVARAGFAERMPDFTPVSVYDYDRDGDPDILWQSKDRRLVVTLVKDATLVGKVEIELASAGPSLENVWVVRGSGDFDSDGDHDLALERIPRTSPDDEAAKVVAIARMDGPRGTVEPVAIQPDLNWKIGAVQDYDGDGGPDLLWENDFTGETAGWLMDGTKVARTVSITGPGFARAGLEMVGPR